MKPSFQKLLFSSDNVDENVISNSKQCSNIQAKLTVFMPQIAALKHKNFMKKNRSILQ